TPWSTAAACWPWRPRRSSPGTSSEPGRDPALAPAGDRLLGDRPGAGRLRVCARRHDGAHAPAAASARGALVLPLRAAARAADPRPPGDVRRSGVAPGGPVLRRAPPQRHGFHPALPRVRHPHLALAALRTRLRVRGFRAGPGGGLLRPGRGADAEGPGGEPDQWPAGLRPGLPLLPEARRPRPAPRR